MGRTGITRLDVEKVALQLQGKGKNPTVDGIRELLGTGSKSTIAEHLRYWKAEQTNSSGNLPHELVALVAGLWERLHAKAELRIQEAEQILQQELHVLKEKHQELQQDYSSLRIKMNESEESLLKERSLKTNLEAQSQTLQQEHTKLQERYEIHTLQLEEQKAENQRLHHLAKQIQTNLEHYQQAMQQKQTEHMLAMEKQQTHFQQFIHNLQHELVGYRDKAQEAERHYNNTSLDLSKFKEQALFFQEKYDTQTKALEEAKHELILLRERHQQTQKAIEAQAEISKEYQEKLKDSEIQIAVYYDQLQKLQKRYQHAEDTLDKLRNEKSFLAQEKAELQGYIQKLEKISAAM